MSCQWQFRPYHWRFKQALQTSHGVWEVRDGILLRLMDEAGNVGWGEIAPIPWFGSETIAQALEFCRQLPLELAKEHIFSIPDTLPCCQFAFESAWKGIRELAIDNLKTGAHRDTPKQASSATQNSSLQAENLTLQPLHAFLRPQSSEFQPRSLDNQAQNLILRPQNSDVEAQNLTLRPQNLNVKAQSSERRPQNLNVKAQSSEHQVQNSQHDQSTAYSALLPAGESALSHWKPLWEQGFHTFKWKIGVYPIALELDLLHALTHHLPKAAKLRVDANGGLSGDEALRWLQICDAINAAPNPSAEIEYIEQPLLPPAQFQAMQHLSQHYQTPIALDESVATLQQLQACYENGWQSIFVIKPAIAGSPARLRQFCPDPRDRCRFFLCVGNRDRTASRASVGNGASKPRSRVGLWYDSLV